MRKKVLVLDDSLLLHKMYDLALKTYRRFEVETHFASNGQEGWSKLHDHPDIDVILLDINMPVMSGLEFLQHLKTEAVFQQIPVILQSSEGREEDIARGLEAGAKGYLTKPFTPDQLHTLLDKILA